MTHHQWRLPKSIPEPGSEWLLGHQNDNSLSSRGSQASGVTDKAAGGHSTELSLPWKQERGFALFCKEAKRATRNKW